MPRIIAGRLKGRRLTAPKGQATRPTSDRVRESLFSRLETLIDLDGSRVLDLYAGTGALGVEAVSRGAVDVRLVEQHRPTAALIGRNLVQLGVTDVARVVNAPVERVLGRGPGAGAFDLVLADPPYPLGEETIGRMLDCLVVQGWLAPGAVVVIERSARSPEPSWPLGFEPEKSRVYGDTAIHLASWQTDHAAHHRQGSDSPGEYQPNAEQAGTLRS